MKEPWFWRGETLAARAARSALSPAALLYDAGQRLRAAAATATDVGAPVLCVGNATLGGAGKTPFCLALQTLLKQRGLETHFLSRGHMGALKGPVRVNHQHTAQEVGDEPLLLAASAPVWVAKNRVAGGCAAAKAGAEAIIMDDGFQNPTIRKTVAFLLVGDGDEGKRRVFPAGPMREPLARAEKRADAVVFTGEGAAPPVAGRPLFRAAKVVETSLTPQSVVAFCGVGAPGRFFEKLEALGFALVAREAFGDHHFYAPEEISRLRALAQTRGAALITTEKDFVRLDAGAREGVHVARLRMAIDDADRLADFALSGIGR